MCHKTAIKHLNWVILLALATAGALACAPVDGPGVIALSTDTPGTGTMAPPAQPPATANGGSGSGTRGGSGSGSPPPTFDCSSTAPADWVLDINNAYDVANNLNYGGSNPIETVYGRDHQGGSSLPELKVPGQVLELNPGNYQHFGLSQSYDRVPGIPKVNSAADMQFGNDPQTTIRAAIPGTVRFVHNPVGGSDTFAIKWTGAITFEHVIFEGDDRAAMISDNPDTFTFHQGFRDIWFCDSHIDGGYDFTKPLTDAGNVAHQNKWGNLSYMVGPTAYSGPDAAGWHWKGGTMKGISDEHFNYFHNIQGPILIEGLDATTRLYAEGAGRTFIQIANRTTEGPDGIGNVTLRHIDIRDVGLETGGGGSAMSFNGNHTGTILIDDVDCRLGENPALHADYNQNITGCVVSFAGGGSAGRPNGDLQITNSHLQVGPAYVGTGSARRPNVQVSDCQSFTLGPATTIVQMKDSAGRLPAQALEITTATIVNSVVLYSNNTVIGDVVFDGRTFKDPNFDGSGYKAMIADPTVLANSKVEIR